MADAQVSAADVLFGIAAPSERSFLRILAVAITSSFISAAGASIVTNFL